MARWSFVAAVVLALFAGSAARALDGDKDKEKEELRKRILKKVEERLKEENRRVLELVEKILDEELEKLDQEEPPKKEPPKKEPPKKEPPKKEPPKKDPPKKDPPKESPHGDEPGYMGVYPEDLQAGMRSLLKLKDGEGVLIAGVAEDGPAAKAGLKANDIVLAVDGEPVGDTEALRAEIMAHKAGEKVKLSVLRKKERLDITVRLAARSDIEPEPQDGDEEEGEEEEEEAPKPTKKPKVVFEPRAESPKFDEMTEEELREETRKFLDEELSEEKAEPKPKTRKILLPGAGLSICAGPGDEDEEESGEEGEEPANPRAEELKELTKRFLRDLVEKLGEGREDLEDELPFDPDQELRKLMERFKDLQGQEMEKLQEQLKEAMEKLGDTDYLRKLLEGMDPADLQEQLKRFLGGEGAGNEADEEDLTEPEEEQPQAPQPEPRKGGRAWLGVTPDELPADMKKQLKIGSGVLVREVIEESPAAEAGLREGDVILSADGQDIESPEALREFLAARKPGAKVTIEVLRKGKTVEKEITLAARKKISMPSPRMFASEPIEDGRGRKTEEKKKTATKKVEKVERRLTLGGEGFDPMKLGLDFGRQQGWKLGLVDRKGKVLFAQPLDNMEALLEMGRQFGLPLMGDCDEPCCRDKKKGKAKGHGDGRKKDRGGKAKERRDDDDECPLRRLFEHGGDRKFDFKLDLPKGKHLDQLRKLGEKHRLELRRFMPEQGKREFKFKLDGLKGGKELQKHIEKMLELHQGKGGKELQKHIEKMLELHQGKGDGKKAKKQPGRRSNKPQPKVEKHERRYVLPGDGERLEKELRRMHEELRDTFKGGRMPAELRDELRELEKELRKMMDRRGNEGKPEKKQKKEKTRKPRMIAA